MLLGPSNIIAKHFAKNQSPFPLYIEKDSGMRLLESLIPSQKAF